MSRNLAPHPAEARYAAAQAALLAESHVRATSRFVGDAQPIHVLEAGRGDPIVLIHGGGSHAAGFAPLLGRLQDHARCFAVDRPGHGLSYRVDYDRIASYRDDAVAFVGRVLDGLSLDRVRLVGHSMGGFFSLAFALAHPQRVERLVLVGAPAGIDRWIPLKLRLLATPGLGPLLWRTVARPTRRGIRSIHEDLLMADGRTLSEAAVACDVAAHQIPGARRGWLSMLRSFLTSRGVVDAGYLRPELPRLSMPVRFVWGELDAFAPPSSGEEACRQIPDASITVLPGVGHTPWLEDLEGCATAVLAALASPERSQDHATG